MNSEPDAKRPDDTSLTRQRRLLGGMVIAMLSAWLLSLASLPWKLLAGAAALVALVLLVMLVVSALRNGRIGTALFAVLLGIPATLLIIAGTGMGIVFYGPMSEYEQCLDTAITERARAACNDQAQNSIIEWFSGVFGG
ncbi:hypothetical protein [Brachybacterium sp. UMB0905]|uniref:hypothetical protein n=1 Tax=Brachybacterium sp. UMB0905 TaxID=2069310 RepID=UPI000C7FFB45|nr:hypothetical protein [Brachybacterium sp. UMB0905]PMC76286.1 hypothetical protein CJ197_03730 [Brachybacterium sp. UMB0905]